MSVWKILRLSLLLTIVVGAGGVRFAAQTGKKTVTRVQKPPRGPSEATAKGIEAFNRGETAEARKFFEAALKTAAGDWEAHNYLGILDDQSGDLTSSVGHFARAARLNPRSAALRNNYGAILLKLNRVKEAAAEFEAALRLDPQRVNALLNLAQIRFNENTPASLKASYDLFARAAALSAADVAVARSLVVVALRLDKKTEAARHYQAYAVQANGLTDAASRIELGGALLEVGLLAEAETELKAALAAEPSNAAATTLLGRVYLARNDIKAAGVLLETAVAKKQATAPIYSLLAIVYEKVGRFENAIPAMRLAIDLAPESENYRFQYGLLLANTEAPAAAVIRLDEALQLFPRSPRLWLARGIAQMKDDKNVEAAESIGKAIALDPKFAQAHAYLGLAKMQIGNYAEAIKGYESALANDGSLAVVHQLIADAMMQQTDADAARIETELKTSIRLAPDFTPAHLSLGKLYVRLRRWDEAATALNEAVRQDSELAEAYYQLGRVYAHLKLKKEADAALAKFKQLSETQKTKAETDLREVVRRLADVRF
jgi:tetratricopeptide (TPR) repeat protein